MKKLLGALSVAAIAAGVFSGCAGNMDRMDNEKTSTAQPIFSSSPMIVTPDPENGIIEDGDGERNGTQMRPSETPDATMSASPATGKIGN